MPRITDDDKSPAVRIAIWYTVTLSVVAVVMRFTAKANRTSLIRLRTFTVDDWLILAALLFSIGQSVAVDCQVKTALGRPIRNITRSQLQVDERASYAADLLYILTLGLAKLSAVLLIFNVTPKLGHKRTAIGVGGFTVLWIVSALFVVGFQCKEPHPSDFVGGKCINRQAWWKYFEAMDILTDVALIALPFWIIWRSHSKLRMKLNVSVLFSLRITAIIACITKLAYWSKIQSSPSPFFELWKNAIINSVIQCLEILPVCFIYLRQFLNTIDSGFFGVDDLARRGETDGDILGFRGTEYLSQRNPLKSARDQEAYQRLRGEGASSQNGVSSQNRDFAETLGIAPPADAFLVGTGEVTAAPRTDTSAFRGRTTEELRERDLPMDHIEMRREVTIEEAPWVGGDTASRWVPNNDNV